MESVESLAFIPVGERPLAMDSSLFERIKARQYDDPHLLVLKDTVQQGGVKEVTIGDDGVLWLQDRICVPNVDGLRELIREEVHSSRYAIHPGGVKMYYDLKQHCWCRRMKKYIFGPSGFLQKIEISEWKWERITRCRFVTDIEEI
ncbi:uncharacterized protein [Nicotiana tomentosiformis]|uniref:uncharacterized protein n=1 Tax=Nicotiana tomentosiformis TaxID=4098 RepID=UPI00388C53F3